MAEMGQVGKRLGAIVRTAVALVVALGVALAAPAVRADDAKWYPGDTHSHISPPDVPPSYTHAKNDLEGAIAAARSAGLKWVILTPHAMDKKDPKTGRLLGVEMEERLAARKAKADDPLAVLGWEYTLSWPGHMTVSFVDMTKVAGKPLAEVLAAVRKEKGLVFVAHPFQLPNLFDKANRSWKPWTAGPRGVELDEWLSGLEVRHPMSPAAMATEQWDEWIGRQKRRIVGVGATDDHWGVLYATTWVRPRGELTRESLHEALREGRVVVGSDASAGTLAVESDRAGADGKPLVFGVGDKVTPVDTQVVIRWEGKGGKLFIDGKEQESAKSPVTFKFEKGSFHWIRLEMGIGSYSNPVYVNLPEAAEPKPLDGQKKLPEAKPDTEAEKSAPPYGTR